MVHGVHGPATNADASPQVCRELCKEGSEEALVMVSVQGTASLENAQTPHSSTATRHYHTHAEKDVICEERMLESCYISLRHPEENVKLLTMGEPTNPLARAEQRCSHGPGNPIEEQDVHIVAHRAADSPHAYLR